MFKGYKLTYFSIIVFAVIITIGLSGAAKQKSNQGKLDLAGITANEQKKEKPDYLPLPLQGIPEKILYRKAYTVSYNKENRIPNLVAWHLTAEHTTGPNKRPGSAWHEDMEVPLPRANTFDYRESGWSRGHMYPAFLSWIMVVYSLSDCISAILSEVVFDL